MCKTHRENKHTPTHTQRDTLTSTSRQGVVVLHAVEIVIKLSCSAVAILLSCLGSFGPSHRTKQTYHYGLVDRSASCCGHTLTHTVTLVWQTECLHSNRTNNIKQKAAFLGRESIFSQTKFALSYTSSCTHICALLVCMLIFRLSKGCRP